MDIAKKLALVILSPLFILLLFTTTFDIGFTRTATHPGAVKRLVAESGLYDSLVPNVLQQNKTISTVVGDIPTTDPDVQKAIKSAITPQAVKQNTEAAIDNIYAWLNGRISQPDFKIDFSSSKAGFADNVAATVQRRLAGLPACDLNQSLAIVQSGQFDAVNATCLPRGLTAAAVADQVRRSLAVDNKIFDQANLSADSIKDSSGQPVFKSQLKNAPRHYQRAKKVPASLAVLTLLTGAGIVLASRTRPAGLRHIGINLVVVGLFMLLFSYAINRAVSTKIVPNIKVDNAVLQQDFRKLATDLTQQVDKNYWFFGGLYLALGAGSIAAVEISRRRTSQSINPNAPNPKIRKV